jgi:septal ring factor EnvC (AmiA/AmiB activator)
LHLLHSIFQKNIKRVAKGVFLVCLLTIPLHHGAQTKTELERRLQANRKKIKLTEQILKQTRIKKESTLAEFLAIEEQIETRSAVISSLEDSISKLNRMVLYLEDDITAVSREIDNMTDEFERLLIEGYKMKRYKRSLQFLLNSSSFNELIVKKKYLDQILEHKKLQLRLIYEKKQENKTRVEDLLHKKQDQEVLLKGRKEEQELLAQAQQERNRVLKDLNRKEAELKDQIRKERKRQEELNRQIQKIIAKEKSKAKPLPKLRDNSGSTFSDLRGRLPWPVQEGYVTQRFGVHQHPTLKNVNTQNNGIDIAVPKNSRAQCVHDGVVTAVLQIPGMQNSILVNHGGYFTVYANLSDVYVKQGQKLAAGAELGTVHLQGDGTSKLHFEVWQGSRKLNPEYWLGSIR